MLTNFIQGLSYFAVSLYIVTYTKTLVDQITATVVLALFNLSFVVGLVLLGHLSDHIPYSSIMVASALGSTLGTFFLWGFGRNAASLYFFVIIFGALVSVNLFSPSSSINNWTPRAVIHTAASC